VKPSVGRIVLYTNLGDRDGKYPPEAQAAIITKVIDRWKAEAEGPTTLEEPPSDSEARYKVSIRVFYEDGEFIMRDVPFTAEPPASEGARGKWGWPPRV
jgi:hypothetical protein